MKDKTCIVIPCYNEEDRLDGEAFVSFASANGGATFTFVDDGSSDATLQVLENLRCRNESAFRVLSLKSNVGKGEAVRRGVMACLKDGPEYVGYWDADLATPLDAIITFAEILEAKSEIDVVTGARVQLLGRNILRAPTRHYLGRVFATVVSSLLRLEMYDTQCGAKLFRNTPWLEKLFEQPFLTSWIFDVEIIARMIHVREAEGLSGVEKAIYEYPLTTWEDIAGSKVGIGAYIRAVHDLFKIYRHYLSVDDVGTQSRAMTKGRESRNISTHPSMRSATHEISSTDVRPSVCRQLPGERHGHT